MKFQAIWLYCLLTGTQEEEGEVEAVARITKRIQMNG